MAYFGEKVKEQRERRQLSQEQLGRLVGVSRRTIIAYETGVSLPRDTKQRKLAEALGVTQRYLMNDNCTNPQEGMKEEPYVQAARDTFGKKGADEMADLLMKSEALFAGCILSEDQRDLYYEAVSQAYFANKQHAREKFGHKKQ